MKKLVLLFLLLIACGKAVEHPVPQAPVRIIEVPAPIVEPSTPVPTPFCSDSDGINEFVKGTVQSESDAQTDSCLSVKVNGVKPLPKLVEYSCVGSKIVADVLNCEFGCKDGACIDGKNLPKQSLIANGNCVAGVSAGGIAITRCSSGCLPSTLCSPQPLKTGQVSLPYQLGCVVRNEEIAEGDWFEFEVSRQVDVLLFTEIEGSELASVELRGPSPAVLLAQKGQRCFWNMKSTVRASLAPGKYVVHASARGVGKDDSLRSFRGLGFSVAFVP